MSTNYYAYSKKAIDAGVPKEWLKELHIGASSNNGFMLQAVVGLDWQNERRFDPMMTVPYFNPVGEKSIRSWSEWAKWLFSGELAIFDESGNRLEPEGLAGLVESQEDPSLPNKKVKEFLRNYNGPLNKGDDHYLDDDGFSMCWWEFS